MSRGQGEREGSRAGLDLVITRLEPCGSCETLGRWKRETFEKSAEKLGWRREKGEKREFEREDRTGCIINMYIYIGGFSNRKVGITRTEKWRGNFCQIKNDSKRNHTQPRLYRAINQASNF